MSAATQPFFIVSSGRSGTQMMEKLLGSLQDVEMHHEYLCTHVQPLAVRYYMGRVGRQEVLDTLEQLHGAAVRYSARPLWGDSSNKLSWLIPELNQLFPTSRFIYLIRDGRKVVSSFYYKLSAECYDDRSTAILQAYVDNPAAAPEPPPEKKYWWNLPRRGTAPAREFRGYDQYQRICFHWGEVNRTILRSLQSVPSHRQRTYRLEDLVSDPKLLEDLLAFLGLTYSAELFAMLQRPHNVSVPEDRLLDMHQEAQLMAIAGDMMRHFGYDQTKQYRMIYDPQGRATGSPLQGSRSM